MFSLFILLWKKFSKTRFLENAKKATISFCFFVNGTLLVSESVSEYLNLVSWSSAKVSWSVSEYLCLVSWSSTWLLSPLQTVMTNSSVNTRHNTQFFYTSALSTAKTVAIATKFAVEMIKG